jgi:hypothetical protein
MTYILSAQRDGPYPAVEEAFARYRAYLAEVSSRLPPGARALTLSDWYFSFAHEAPHDAWLESVTVQEAPAGTGSQHRPVSILVRLLGAYHDGHIEFQYRGVVSYRLELAPTLDATPYGHRDWRYDEFRLAEHGGIEHEIEWWGPDRSSTWLIEAADVEYRWIPLPASGDKPGLGGADNGVRAEFRVPDA